MVRLLILFAAAALPVFAAQPTTDTNLAVISHVTVIDGSGALAQSGMTVVIEGNRIQALGKDGSVAVPRNAKVIDASGKYLIPGLWDMHIHMFSTRASALPALVANGVTGVRDLGGLLRDIDEWRIKIDSGLLVGPRIIRAGPTLNGRQFGVH
ncbi:MAG: amidohydrolase family protein [Verrucomicrobia bacterium]|nr:amidohydrolase family protein [Verrucomicrobiota bacterium]